MFFQKTRKLCSGAHWHSKALVMLTVAFTDAQLNDLDLTRGRRSVFWCDGVTAM